MSNSDKIDMILHDMVIDNSSKIFRISKWQLIIGFVLSTYNVFSSWCLFAFYFTWDNNYMCALPFNVSPNDAIPLTPDLNFDKCHVYENFNKNLSNKTIPCPIGYNHTNYPYQKTIASSFNLYCDDEKYGNLAENMVFTGIFVGSLLCAFIGDRFGRRPVMLAFFWIGAIAGLCTAFSPTFWFFVICQFICGVCSQGYGITAYTMTLELFATSDRAICFMFALMWPFGMMLLGLFSYLSTKWRHLYLATSIPMLITFTYYSFVPESLYWLAQQRRDADVNKVLSKAYRMNKTSTSRRHTYSSDLMLQTNNTDHTAKASKYDLVKNAFVYLCEVKSSFTKRKTFPVILLISSFFLIVMTFLYNGLTLAASVFSSNRDLDWLITSLLEIPSIIIVAPLVNRFGRKMPCGISFFLVSIAFVMLAAFTKQEALSAVNHTAKFLVAGTYSIVWFLVPELLPTNHRNFGMGLSIAASKILAILSPMIANELTNNRVVFCFVLAALSLICSALSQVLWEPLGKSLPETVEDMPPLKIASLKDFKQLTSKTRMFYLNEK